jgi:hypothetical protein
VSDELGKILSEIGSILRATMTTEELEHGRDSTSDDQAVRIEFLAGRIRALMMIYLGGYEVPLPTEQDTTDFIMRNTHSGRRYRVSVEEVTEQ